MELPRRQSTRRSRPGRAVRGARGSPFERPHAEHRGHRTGCWKRWRHALFNSSGDGRIPWVAKARCRLTDPDELFVGSLVERRSGNRLLFADTVPSSPSASPTRSTTRWSSVSGAHDRTPAARAAQAAPQGGLLGQALRRPAQTPQRRRPARHAVNVGLTTPPPWCDRVHRRPGVDHCVSRRTRTVHVIVPPPCR
jgi:hypothetical protein